LTSWKRVKDQSGKPKGFGFATFEDPDSVLCALRVLSGEKTEGVVLKAADGSGVEKKLIVRFFLFFLLFIIYSKFFYSCFPSIGKGRRQCNKLS
jgi:hypothetical protein